MFLFFKKLLSQKFLIKKFFVQYIYCHFIGISISIVLVIIIALCSANIIRLISPTFNAIYAIENFSEFKTITSLAILIMLLHFLKAISEFFQQYLVKNISNKILIQIQKDIFKSLMISEHVKIYPDRIFSHFTNDVSLVRGILSIILGNWIKYFVSTIFVIYTMFRMNYKLSLLVIVFFPIALLISYCINHKLKFITNQIQHKLSNFTKKINDVFSRIKLIKISSKEDFEYRVFCNTLSELEELYKQSSKLESVTAPVMEIISGLGTVIIITLGSIFLLKSNNITAGEVVAFNTAFVSIYRPFKTLISMNLHIKIAFTALSNLLHYTYDNRNVISHYTTSDVNLSQKALIELKNIDLQINCKQILQNINMKFNKNCTYLIVGDSGSGKSSLVNLILGFYLPNSGKIEINGFNLQKLNIQNIRSQIDFISQENMLINDTILNNINYSSKNFDIKKILSISDKKFLRNFLEKLPNKYDFLVEHKGYNLSGGERQIISLARSMIRDAPILILDEATSSIDFITERKILNFLQEIRKDKMTIIITHRIKNLINLSDNIILMANGKLISQGQHKDLYQKNEQYKFLYDNEEEY